MFDDNTTATQDSIETIYRGDDAHVEDFRIRPKTVSDEKLRMHVQMRIGGADGVYYLTATVTYGGENEGHSVTIRRRSAEELYSIETDVVMESPEDAEAAVQAIHDTYISAAQDWYEYARAADEAGENHD